MSTTTTPVASSWTTTTLYAPDPLMCTWTGANSIMLMWTNTASKAGGYSYERSNSPGSGYSQLGTTTGAAAVTATDPNPLPTTLRYYRVRSTASATWTSPYSAASASNTCNGTITSLYTAGIPASARSAAVDSSGNVYTADETGNQVFRTTPGGVTAVYAGTGTAGYSGDGGPATSAQLRKPGGLALDSSDNLYIADRDNNRVRRVSSGGIISTYAGTGVNGYSGDGGPATSATMSKPTDLSFANDGSLFVSERDNDVIRKITSGGVITTVAGTGIRGYDGDDGSATSARLNAPDGVFVDSSGRVIIADTGNNRIRSVESGVITTIAGGGSTSTCSFSGPASGVQLNKPGRAIANNTGLIIISDTVNDCVRTLTGTTIAQFAGTGSPGYSGDNGPAISAQVNTPDGLAFDAAGNLYIADLSNDVIRKVLKP